MIRTTPTLTTALSLTLTVPNSPSPMPSELPLNNLPGMSTIGNELSGYSPTAISATEKRRILAKALLEAALEGPDEDADQDQEVKEEDQKSLSVGIIGAPNAGKSALTNFMVGTKVAAVSRKTNTTTHEVLGVMTKGDTQICFFDTPGLMLNRSGYLHKDMKVRVESAWSSVNLYDVLMVIFDVHRHLTYISEIRTLTPLFESEIPYGIDHRLVDWKELRDGSLRIEHHFITSKMSQRKILVGKNGSKIILILMIHPYRPDSRVIRLIKRMGEEPNPKQIRILCMNKVDLIEKKKELLKVAEQFKDLPGYGRRIGIEANEELRSIFKREVHLILQVRVKT
ncbi:hypothetical protein GOBAR_DD07732 [Gossypium barbadense]|nr:hypothetical protein GOBAR_DD07732 [Gossypium barbadense]